MFKRGEFGLFVEKPGYRFTKESTLDCQTKTLLSTRKLKGEVFVCEVVFSEMSFTFFFKGVPSFHKQ